MVSKRNEATVCPIMLEQDLVRGGTKFEFLGYEGTENERCHTGIQTKIAKKSLI